MALWIFHIYADYGVDDDRNKTATLAGWLTGWQAGWLAG